MALPTCLPINTHVLSVWSPEKRREAPPGYLATYIHRSMWPSTVHTATFIWLSPATRRTPLLVRCSSAPKDAQPPPRRRSANYQPNSWDYNALLSLKGGSHDRVTDIYNYYMTSLIVRQFLFE